MMESKQADAVAPVPPPTAFDAADPGLPGRLAAWLEAQWGRPVSVSRWQRFPVGMSWVTVGLTATCDGQEQSLILRLGDPKGLFAPYRTEPEFLALSALAHEPGVPVPAVLARCDDVAVLGAPFMVTARVAGDTPTPWNSAAIRDEAERAALGHAFSDVLGALHAFDWSVTPLAGWAVGLTPSNAALRELDRWAAEAGHPGQPLPPAMHHGLRWLQAHAPIAEPIALVHGDYRVGNFLRVGDRITAILDWELVHLGDPHEDLAWAVMRAFTPTAGQVGGLVDRATFLARWSARSGLRLDESRLRYYQVMMQFKSAAMLLGAVRRVEAGRAGDARMAAMGFQLAPTLMEMLRLMEAA